MEDQICERLAEYGLCVEPEFLSRHETELLAEDLLALKSSGAFHRAGIGSKAQEQIRNDVRRDQILWFEPSDLSATQSLLWTKLENLRVALNRSLYLGLQTLEGHYASYPPGGFYQRHIDRFRDDDARTVTIVLYLNPNWQPGDGGELKLYLPEGECLIEPKGGTLVVFMSDQIEHEVIPSNVERLSFAGWYKRALSHLIATPMVIK
jgi:SM-20-related protein